MNIFWSIKALVLLIMGVNEDVKNLICENGPHEQLCVQSPKVQLRCLLAKAWVTSDVLEA